MSLWTPGGEHPVDRGRPADPPADPPADQGAAQAPDILSLLSPEQRAEFEQMTPEEQEQARMLVAQMAETRQRMLETPAAVVVANHAMGLYELAAIHMQAQPPQLDEAKVAVDGLAGLLDAVGDRLGPDGSTLRDALAQLQLAYVQIKAAADAAETPGDASSGAEGDTSSPQAPNAD